MAFKKHNWMSYGQHGEIVELIIRDNTGGKIDFFRCNSKKDYPKIIKLIDDKYGFSPLMGEKSLIDIEEENELLR